MSIMTKDEKKLLWVRRMLFGLCLAGLFVATYLFIAYSSQVTIACGGSHGCDVVRASRWASVFGIPTPLFGMAFYTGMATLFIIRTLKPLFYPTWLYRLVMVGATAGLIESIFLTGVQVLEIKQYCTWCLASAVTTTLIFIISWGDTSKHLEVEQGIKEFRIQFYTLSTVVVIGAVSMAVLFAPHANGDKPVIEQFVPSVEAVESARRSLYPEDLSWSGSASATITIVEFVDFECPACREFYSEFEKVKVQLGDRLRYAYRMFPLPSHEHSFDAALAAVCAKDQGAFDSYASLLMEEEGLERDDLIRRAAELRLNMDQYVSCLNGSESKRSVQKDLEDGDALKVTSTPTLFINDMMIDGLPTADQLIEIINEVERSKSAQR
jgi:uncharacterized membrane protein/predicted DsbA family dithiol-disulfide isomerase